MNDGYVEQLVAKKWEASDTVMTVIIVLVALLAMGISVLLIFTPLYSLILLLFAAISYVASRFITNLSVEYEYCLVNGELTVDKIINKRKRKRIIVVQARNFEHFMPYDAQALANENFSAFIKAADCAMPENGWCAQFNQAGVGKTALVLSPNEKLLDMIKPYLKPEVRREGFVK